MCGAKFEGKDEGLLVERLEDLASRLGVFKDESVNERKDNFTSDEKADY